MYVWSKKGGIDYSLTCPSLLLPPGHKSSHPPQQRQAGSAVPSWGHTWSTGWFLDRSTPLYPCSLLRRATPLWQQTSMIILTCLIGPFVCGSVHMFTYDINLSLESASGGAGTSDLHGGQLSPCSAFRVVYLREVGAVTILQNCTAFQEIKNKIKKGKYVNTGRKKKATAFPTGHIEQPVQGHNSRTGDGHLVRLCKLPQVGVRVVALHRVETRASLPTTDGVHKTIQHHQTWREATLKTFSIFTACQLVYIVLVPSSFNLIILMFVNWTWVQSVYILKTARQRC